MLNNINKNSIILGSVKSSFVSRYRLLIIFLLCTFICAVQTDAATYYVATDGNDSSPDATDINTPWKTINYAASQLSPGDTLYVRGGTYRESVTMSVSGTSDNRITIQNYSDETAVIDGSEILGSWTKCTSQSDAGGNSNWENIYYAYAPASVTWNSANLYQNDQLLSVSQYPALTDPLYMDATDDYLSIGAEYVTNTTIIDSRLADMGGAELVGSYVAVWINPNVVVYKKITDYNSDETKITFEDVGGGGVYTTRDTKYSIINCIFGAVLNKAGEYYFEETAEGDGTHKIYLWPLNNQDLASEGQVTVTTRSSMFNFGQCHYITIDGISFTKGYGAVINCTLSTTNAGLTFRNSEISFCRGLTNNMFWLNSVTGAVVENNNLHDNPGERGIVASGSNIIVRNNTVENQGGTAIYFAAVDTGQITGNTVSDCRGTHGNGITAYQGSSDILIADNTVTNSNIAVTYQSSSNITIYNNVLDGQDNSSFLLADWGGNTGSVAVLNNTILGSSTDGAITFSTGYSLICKNNLIDGSPGSGAQTSNNINSNEVDMSGVLENYPVTEAQTSIVDEMTSEGLNLNTTVLYIRDGMQELLDSGQYLIYQHDGTTRTLTSDAQRVFYMSNWRTQINFTPAIADLETGKIAVWDNTDDLVLDIRPKGGGDLVNTGADVSAIIDELNLRSTFSDFDFDKDIAGNDRTIETTDIGAYEFTGPALASIGDKSVEEESTLSFTISATDPDGDSVTYSASGTAIDAGASINSETGAFSWTPDSTQSGTYQATFTATAGGQSDFETITITVSNLETQYTLTSSSTSGGSVTTPGEGDYSYDHGTVVSIQADPDDNYEFLSWTGTAVDAGKVGSTTIADNGSASTTVTVDADYTLIANFRLAQRTLSISSSDNGSVTTPGEGDYSYDHGTVVSVVAAVSGNNYFENWTGTAVDAGKVADSDSASTTVTVDADYTLVANFDDEDTIAPSLSNLSPDDGDTQVPIDTLIILTISDAGTGVDLTTVKIYVEGDLIYDGANETSEGVYDSTGQSQTYKGVCRRTGTAAAYTFFFQADARFDYEQHITVTVNACDLAPTPNCMSQSYSFDTVMREFGANIRVNSDTVTLLQDRPDAATDSSGNIWAVWDQTTVAGDTDIYIGKLADGGTAFGTSVQVTSDTNNQQNAVIAIDSSDKIYIAWQDWRNDEWDIYLTTTSNGTTFTSETRITDPNSSQTNPAIAIDGSDKVYVAWQDDQNSNNDIYIASSSNSFASQTTSQITSNTSSQTTPAITITSDNTVYVAWTDYRNASSDIYAAASNVGPWTNVPVVSNAYNQSAPAIAAEDTGSILHLLWVDDASGNDDVLYAETTSGLTGVPLTGSDISDDSTSSDQSSPSICVSGTTGSDLRVCACWQDWRDVISGNGDTDIYYAETSFGTNTFGTNILVNDDTATAAQSAPVVNRYDSPYLVWTDNRNGDKDIYYAGALLLGTVLVTSPLITASAGGTVEVNSSTVNFDSSLDARVVIPAGALPFDTQITISKMLNPPGSLTGGGITYFEFGPSKLHFNSPVTIYMPHAASDCPGHSEYRVWWYDPETFSWSPSNGIVARHGVDPVTGVHYISFETDHFTGFGVGGGSGGGGGGGGGGGCSIYGCGNATFSDFAIPYVVLAAVLTFVKRRDRRNKAA